MSELTPLQRNEECRRIARDLRDVLNTAAKYRDKRQFTVDGPDGPELGWITYERSVMAEAVNGERAVRGRPSVRRDDLLRAERLATGHSDYVAQFAWGCAELVMYPEREGAR